MIIIMNSSQRKHSIKRVRNFSAGHFLGIIKLIFLPFFWQIFYTEEKFEKR